MVLDFKKLTEQIQGQNGYCSLRPEHYATVSGRRIDSVLGTSQDTREPWVIHPYSKTNPSPVFRLLVGSTGHESWFVDTLLADPNPGWWCACAGTTGRWDRLMINGAEVLEILRGCGYANH